jgi:hypothetical protein
MRFRGSAIRAMTAAALFAGWCWASFYYWSEFVPLSPTAVLPDLSGWKCCGMTRGGNLVLYPATKPDQYGRSSLTLRGPVRIWNPEAGRIVRELFDESHVVNADWNDPPERIVALADSSLTIIDPDDGRMLLQTQVANFDGCAFSRDGNFFADEGRDRIAIFDLRSSRMLWSRPEQWGRCEFVGRGLVRIYKSSNLEPSTFWSTATGASLPVPAWYSDDVHCELSPDERFALRMPPGKPTDVVDAASARRLWTMPEWVTEAVFDKSGREVQAAAMAETGLSIVSSQLGDDNDSSESIPESGLRIAGWETTTGREMYETWDLTAPDIGRWTRDGSIHLVDAVIAPAESMIKLHPVFNRVGLGWLVRQRSRLKVYCGHSGRYRGFIQTEPASSVLASSPPLWGGWMLNTQDSTVQRLSRGVIINNPGSLPIFYALPPARPWWTLISLLTFPPAAIIAMTCLMRWMTRRGQRTATTL